MARQFDGSNDGYSIPDIIGLGDMSWWMLLYVVSRNQNAATVFSCYQTTGGTDRFHMQTRNDAFGGAYLFGLNVDGTGGLATGSVITTGAWMSVGVTRKGTTAKAFVGGSQVGSNVTVGGGLLSMQRIRLACEDTGTGDVFFANVRIAEMGIWNMDIGSAGIYQLEKNRCPESVWNSHLIRYVSLKGAVKDEADRRIRVSSIDSPSIVSHPDKIIYPKKNRPTVKAPAAPGGGQPAMKRMGGVKYNAGPFGNLQGVRGW